MRKIISRPNPEVLPEFPVPIYVRSTGYNEADPDWEENCAKGSKNFVQLFWCIQGIGEFRFEGRSVLLHPDEVIYQLPGEAHVHRSADTKTQWRYYWFTFDGPGAENFMRSYHYEQTALHAGACPVKLFHELETAVRQQTNYAQRHAIAVATEILALAGCDSGKCEHNTVKRFLELAEDLFADPDFTAEAAANEMQIHRTTLYRTVKRELSLSPKQVLRQLRIQKALSLLLETELPIKTVAAESGFNKVDYFCSLIARQTGCTPAKYRKHASVDS
ncbi:MAG: AraC family transcriptional regulator [Victivallaceae bacterium]|nr:AraC family transcriptional regulator [Victivallaceae bacterium]